MMPAALLADLIDDDEEPLRALIVVAGNPALSIGGSARLQDALAFARPPGDHRPVPQRDRRAGRLRAPGHRPVRARGPQHLRAGRAEDALRAVDGQGHRARGRAARGVALPGRAPRRRRSTGGPRRLAHRSAAAHLRRRALERGCEHPAAPRRRRHRGAPGRRTGRLGDAAGAQRAARVRTRRAAHHLAAGPRALRASCGRSRPISASSSRDAPSTC